MVIDTSAIAAILFGEPEAQRFADAIEDDETRLISAGTLLESCLVAESTLGEVGARELNLLILKAAIQVVPFSDEQVKIARHAWRKFGKGRRPAGLNFGDCFSYALSKATGEPLLFKGANFSRTDVGVWTAVSP